MRGSLLSLLVVAAILAASSGAATTPQLRAAAVIASDANQDFGRAAVSGPGEENFATSVDETAVTVGDGNVLARVDDATSGYAKAVAHDIDVLAGRVQIDGARRAIRKTAEAVKRSGGVYYVRVDGKDYGNVFARRTIRSGDLKLTLNAGDAAVRVETEDGDDIRVAVAAVLETRAEPTPTPTVTPTPTATTTVPPSSGGSTYVPSVPSSPITPSVTRKPAPSVNSRLTSGGYAFPVFGKARVADTFGATRAEPIGTHEGVDIFAKFGSPVVAVRDGRISHVGTLPISGNRLWLTTGNGDAFFYAHLSAFSNAARNGRKVKAGTVLGFTGNTGDAEPTPPHLHFEVHPGGLKEDAVDPYPIVTAWQRADDVPPGAWLRQLGPDATERPGALVTVRDYIAE